MNTENRQLVTDEPVGFEKLPVEVQDFRKITNRFRGIYRIFEKETGAMNTENRQLVTDESVGFEK